MSAMRELITENYCEHIRSVAYINGYWLIRVNNSVHCLPNVMNWLRCGACNRINQVNLTHYLTLYEQLNQGAQD